MAGSCRQDRLLADADDVAALLDAVGAAGGRHLAVPGTLNCRDVGGYPMIGGGVTAWRRLFRSDGLHRLEFGAQEALAALRLRTVLDLRTSEETRIAPSPVDELAGHGALTMHISLIGDDFDAVPDELGEIYNFVVDMQGPAIAAAVRSLARPGGLPALVHCTAGKDRTGIVVAFALAAVGVPDQVIAADYALSSLYLDPRHTPTIGRVQESTGLGDRLTAALLASPPELIVAALDRARQRSGSIAGYLAAHGVPHAELGALCSALVAEGEDDDEADEPDGSR